MFTNEAGYIWRTFNMREPTKFQVVLHWLLFDMKLFQGVKKHNFLKVFSQNLKINTIEWDIFLQDKRFYEIKISDHIFRIKRIIKLLKSFLFQGQTLRCLSSAAATNPTNPTNLALRLGVPLTVSIHFYLQWRCRDGFNHSSQHH